MKIKFKVEAFQGWMARNNFTQKEVAERLDVSERWLSMIFRAKVVPSPAIRAVMQKVTGMEWDELFEEERL